MAAGVAKMTLLGAWHSPFVKSAQMVLKMNGVDKYEYFEENLHKDEKSQRLRNTSKNATVPVLILHHGKTIVGTEEIIKHFEDKKEEKDDGADQISWKNITKKVISPLWNGYWGKDEVDRNASRKNAIEGLEILEKQIKGKKFFGGDKIGLLDVTACFLAYGVQALEKIEPIEIFTKTEFPCLFEWVENYKNHPWANEEFPVDEVLAKKYLPREDLLRDSYEVGLRSGLPNPDNRYAFYKAAFLKTETAKKNCK